MSFWTRAEGFSNVNIFDRPIGVGIPVPDAFYTNYVSVPLEQLAMTSRMTVEETRADIEKHNAEGRTLIALFRTFGTGEEWVSGYFFR